MRAGSKDELCIRLYFRAALRAALLTAAAKPAPSPPSAAHPAQPRDCQQHWEPVQCCSYKWVGSGHHFTEALLPTALPRAAGNSQQCLHSAAFPPFSGGSQGRNVPHWSWQNVCSVCSVHSSSWRRPCNAVPPHHDAKTHVLFSDLATVPEWLRRVWRVPRGLSKVWSCCFITLELQARDHLA